MDLHNISFLDYFKKKYNIENLENIIAIFYLSFILSIVLYLSNKYEIIQTTINIFILIIFLSLMINRYYNIKYQEQISFIRQKFENIKELLNDIIETNNES
tara:strand:+ start:329 stop:631 length:303 start_codon:yes stop_codon:yes gene_type:complete